jgi:hypothetical protein
MSQKEQQEQKPEQQEQKPEQQEQQEQKPKINTEHLFWLCMDVIESDSLIRRRKTIKKTITKPVEEKQFTHKRCYRCKQIFLHNNRSDKDSRDYCSDTCYEKHVYML